MLKKNSKRGVSGQGQRARSPPPPRPPPYEMWSSASGQPWLRKLLQDHHSHCQEIRICYNPASISGAHSFLLVLCVCHKHFESSQWKKLIEWKYSLREVLIMTYCESSFHLFYHSRYSFLDPNPHILPP